jgi:hypothetical protein
MTEAPTAVTVDDDEDIFDLAKQRTVRREATGAKPIRLKFAETVHTLPDELPLDVFGPLEDINVDVALLIRLALDAREGREGATKDATNIVIDMLVTNPALPREVLAAIREMAIRLLGQACYDDLIASRPSREDLGGIATFLFERYGVNLPEASEPSGSSDDDGTTPRPTSPESTDGTSEVSGPTPETPASSAPAA